MLIVSAVILFGTISAAFRIMCGVSIGRMLLAIEAISGAASSAVAFISAATVRTAGTADAQFCGTESEPMVPARPPRLHHNRHL